MLRREMILAAGLVSGLILGVSGYAAAATIAWSEAINGSFSHDGLMPTQLKFGVGGNDVFGDDGRSVAGGPVNPDYFTFNVPAGFALTAIAVLPGTTSAGPLNDSFIGLEAGNQLTLPTTATTAAGLLGWFHFGPEDINSNILPDIAVSGQGASGFTLPLGPGAYSVWVQETGVCAPTLCQYGLEFVVAAVPEPASSAGLLTGLAALGAIWRKRRKRA